jgi:hypothetical protein
MAKNKPAGGIGSRVVVKPTIHFAGQSAKGIAPGHAAQIGEAQGNRAMEKQTNYRGDPKFAAAPFTSGVPLGNEKALDVGGGGPGTGRVVYGCGVQAQHGPVAGKPAPQGRDILNDFGPNSPGVKGR